MNGLIKSFLRDTRGTTAIEYALIATIISVGIIVSVTAVGSSSNSVYNTLETKVRPELG